MDTKQALGILNLPSDASLEDAKVSFRTLAKKYHPDKLIYNNGMIIDNDKMKEINLAFHNLKNILKSEKIITEAQDIANQKVSQQKKTQEKAETEKTGTEKTNFFKSFGSFFKAINKNFFNSTRTKTKKREPEPSRTFKKHGKPFDKTTGQSDNYVKAKKKKNFDSVLHKTIKSSLKKNIKSPYQFKSKQKVKIQNTYFKYMELRRKMRPERKRIDQEGCAPIGKINPISKIKKI